MPTRNQVFDKIQTAGSLTDSELSKALVKSEMEISKDGFNKILLDLEILGLINVTWITKDMRRIEVTGGTQDEDPVEKQNREMSERDYESSFPSSDA